MMVYYHPWLKENLDALKEAVLNDDWDGMLLVDGMEGSGKSSFAQQVAAYLDPEFCLWKIVFTPEQFKSAVMKAKKGDCIIWDEVDFESTAAASKQQRALRRFMQQIRDKNLFLILVGPYFFDWSKYISVSRSRFLLHLFTYGFKRGYFEFYDYNRKKQLYFQGKKKFYDYSVVPHSWKNPGNFGKGYMVDEAAYKAKKRLATASLMGEHDDDTLSVRNKLIKKLKEHVFICKKCDGNFRLSAGDVGGIVGLSHTQVHNIINTTAENEGVGEGD